MILYACLLSFTLAVVDSMNAQLMFEMKMAFLLRISLTREGAQKLMEYGVIEALADCKFIDQKPDAEIHPSGWSSGQVH